MLVEQPADGAPGEEVEGRRRRQVAGAGEDERRGKVAGVGAGPGPGGEVDHDGGQGADEPEVEQAGVDLARAEDAAGADEAPDNASVEKDASLGAGVVGWLVSRADIFDGAEGPVHDGNFHQARPDCCDGLSHEHGAGRDFHVVA